MAAKILKAAPDGDHGQECQETYCTDCDIAADIRCPTCRVCNWHQMLKAAEMLFAVHSLLGLACTT